MAWRGARMARIPADKPPDALPCMLPLVLPGPRTPAADTPCDGCREESTTEVGRITDLMPLLVPCTNVINVVPSGMQVQALEFKTACC
jgi:hypothetical protein